MVGSALEKLSLSEPAAKRGSPQCLPLLPAEVLAGIFRQTDSRDALALSGTCTQLRPFATWAYRDIRFALGRPEHPKTLSATVEALQLLLGALRSRPDYAMAVRSIVLCDPIPASLRVVNSANVPWPSWNLLAAQLDFSVAELLLLTPMLRRFIWSNYAVGDYIDAQQTTSQLKKLQHLQEVSVYRIWAEISDAELAARTHSIRVEKFSVDCFKSSPWWCLPFLRSNNRLRSLDLRFAGDPQDTEWTRELYLAAISWRKLKTLNVECSEEGAHAMLGLIKHCAVCALRHPLRCSCMLNRGDTGMRVLAITYIRLIQADVQPRPFDSPRVLDCASLLPDSTITPDRKRVRRIPQWPQSRACG